MWGGAMERTLVSLLTVPPVGCNFRITFIQCLISSDFKDSKEISAASMNRQRYYFSKKNLNASRPSDIIGATNIIRLFSSISSLS